MLRCPPPPPSPGAAQTTHDNLAVRENQKIVRKIRGKRDGTSRRRLMVARLSSARVFILDWHPGGGLSGGMATSGRAAVAGMKMSARLKFFLHSPQIRRPRHLLIRICAEQRAEFQGQAP